MKKLIARIVPGPIKSRILNMVRAWITEHNRRKSSQIPRYNLTAKHIENSKLLPNREGLLACLPKGAVVAELGVDEGKFSEQIVSICQPKKLHLIDYWGTERYNQNKRRSVESKFEHQIKDKNIIINVGLSTDVVDEFPDNYFDWIYIDTSHSYKTTIAELEKYRPKMKKGGIMAGHDYILGNWNNMVRYGVIEAVAEFCVKYEWEIIYITVELDSPASFAIREIKNPSPQKP